ncbi:hypothetical protein ElP_74150 (plasmid) [Tautonia plasticadhaerens]|uniref:Uncharacterized protein n=1 Tax=Tautonia plasticadhaerens TaxID=2527974 RepID=A0A518HF52_9BACT|nr:hypothetical protein ElP_74150 [Tautonia plasticadhaerens]
MGWMSRGRPERGRIGGPRPAGDATAERLDRLERSNRRILVVLCLLGSATLVAVGAVGTGARSPDGDRITLRDRGVALRAMPTGRVGAEPRLFDEDGGERLRIGTPDDGPAVPDNPRAVGGRWPSAAQ